MIRLRKFIVPLLFILVGLLTAPWEGDQKWIWRGMILYSIPLACYLSNSFKAKEVGILVGACTLMQALASPFLLDKVTLRDYITLKPNFHKVINVKEGVVSGIEGDQAYTTDEKGFRVTKKINYKNKPENVLRVFAIGSSTVEGMLLGDQVNWPHLLQQRLSLTLTKNQVEVINAGKSASSSRNHLATFLQILKYKPDIAIFLMGGNDWGHHIKSSQNQKHFFDKLTSKLGLRLSTRAKENLSILRTAMRFDNTLIAEIIKTFKNSLKKKRAPKENILHTSFSGGSITTSMDSLNRSDKRVFLPTQVSSEYRYFISKIGDTCKKNKLVCIFANQPTAYNTNATDKIKSKFWVTPHNESYTLDFNSMIHISSMYNQFIMSYALDNNIFPCDVSGGIPPTLDYLWDDIHFNIGGAKKAGEIIFECTIQALDIDSLTHENSKQSKS